MALAAAAGGSSTLLHHSGKALDGLASCLEPLAAALTVVLGAASRNTRGGRGGGGGFALGVASVLLASGGAGREGVASAHNW
jgi:hypothetical protein